MTHQKRVEQLYEIKRSQIKKETGQYSGSYRARAALIRATAVVCHLCGEGLLVSGVSFPFVPPGQVRFLTAHGTVMVLIIVKACKGTR